MLEFVNVQRVEPCSKPGFTITFVLKKLSPTSTSIAYSFKGLKYSLVKLLPNGFKSPGTVFKTSTVDVL